jgi:hypothetical protein
MAFVIFEPVVLAGVPQPAPAAPVPAATTTAVLPHGRRATTAPGFDCCLNLALWKAPDGAADQKEGR